MSFVLTPLQSMNWKEFVHMDWRSRCSCWVHLLAVTFSMIDITGSQILFNKIWLLPQFLSCSDSCRLRLGHQICWLNCWLNLVGATSCIINMRGVRFYFSQKGLTFQFREYIILRWTLMDENRRSRALVRQVSSLFSRGTSDPDVCFQWNLQNWMNPKNCKFTSEIL